MKEETDFTAARLRLITHLRAEGIGDETVLKALAEVPREKFVLPSFVDQAYEDHALPIAHDQTISQPLVVATMTEALELEPSHMVLEIGTGSGYQAAVLAKLVRRVHTVERIRGLHEKATKLFESLKLHNITTHLADGNEGWKAAAPYDRIIVTAAAEELPLALLDQLRDGGMMVVPVESASSAQELLKITKRGEAYHQELLMPVRFVPLCSGVA